MRAMRRRHAVLALGLAAIAGGAAAQPAPRPRPPISSPAVVAPPTWWRALPMPDGRTFVTDGGMSIDVAVAKPAALPTEVLPPASGKTIAGLLEAPHTAEHGLGDLRPGTAANTFITPDGVVLNGNYITLLRQAMAPARTRLRTRGKTDAVVVVSDGRAVAVMMPIQPAR